MTYPNSPCDMGDIITRHNSQGELLAKYLVVTDAMNCRIFHRSSLVWPKGDPQAFLFKLFVLYSCPFVAEMELVGTTITMWLHPDEVCLCQTLEGSGDDSVVFSES